LRNSNVLIDSSHKKWIAFTAVAAVVAVALWWWLDRQTPGGLTGGSVAGLWYALLGSLCMLFAWLLSAVRHFPRLRLPPRKWWLKGHIWLGLLSGVLILCHSGFRFGGPLEQVLWAVFGLTLLTGVFGLAVQQIVPRLLTTRVPAEAPYEQIPHICAVIRRRADALVQKALGASDAPAAGGGTTMQMSLFLNTTAQLLDFYEAQVRPFFADRYQRSSPLANPVQADAVFDTLAGLAGTEELKGLVEQLQVLCRERRQLGEQERLYHWLHAWLFLHIPLSILLLFLGAAHALVALYY
jgi:hypothetical protein